MDHKMSRRSPWVIHHDRLELHGCDIEVLASSHITV